MTGWGVSPAQSNTSLSPCQTASFPPVKDTDVESQCQLFKLNILHEIITILQPHLLIKHGGLIHSTKMHHLISKQTKAKLIFLILVASKQWQCSDVDFLANYAAFYLCFATTNSTTDLNAVRTTPLPCTVTYCDIYKIRKFMLCIFSKSAGGPIKWPLEFNEVLHVNRH